MDKPAIEGGTPARSTPFLMRDQIDDWEVEAINRVVERARLYQLLNEKQIAAGTAMLGEQAKAIGSELDVAAIVVGSYARVFKVTRFRHGSCLSPTVQSWRRRTH
jgi:hypothetical protein